MLPSQKTYKKRDSYLRLNYFHFSHNSHINNNNFFSIRFQLKYCFQLFNYFVFLHILSTGLTTFVHRMRGFLSIDIDVSALQVNQCTSPYSIDYRHARTNTQNRYEEQIFNQIEAFHDTHKCHLDSMTVRMHMHK